MQRRNPNLRGCVSTVRQVRCCTPQARRELIQDLHSPRQHALISWALKYVSGANLRGRAGPFHESLNHPDDARGSRGTVLLLRSDSGHTFARSHAWVTSAYMLRINQNPWEVGSRSTTVICVTNGELEVDDGAVECRRNGDDPREN